MKPLYIFDLDGTLALIDHRLPILDELDDPKRWRRFYSFCDKDLPNEPVIRTMGRLQIAGADIWIFSGRSDEVKDKTVTWLLGCTPLLRREIDTCLTMRKENDYTPDDILKQRWLNAMQHEDRQRLVAAFEDRDRVVNMWRQNGVPCFQVAPGEF